ncbi:MAG: hypothetical protein IT342_12515, partial [Candidatus Melainabacteria bacterium]|nr:hypothetical protein [Candidatus Melainabacteria bacterium]
ILTRMATLGGGTSALVTPGAKLEKALSQIGREIGVPVLTGLKLEAVQGSLEAETITPANLPDLFRGRASTIFFKMTNGLLPGKGKKKIRIKGTRADGSAYVEEVTEKKIELPAVASLYAKSLIRDLEDEFREQADRNKIRKRIIDLSLKHSVLCRFTAFIAVDESEVVNKDGKNRTVVQPVHQPADWEAVDGSTLGAVQSFGMAASYGSYSPSTMGQLIRQRQASDAAPQGSGWGTPPPPAMPGSAKASPQACPAPQQWSQDQSTGNTGSWGAPAAGAGGGWGAAPGSPPNTGAKRCTSLNQNSGASSWNEPIQERSAKQPPQAQGPSELLTAINEMVRQFAAVLAQYLAGENIDWKPLEDVRALCLKHLQTSKFAASAPRLQQFLRSEAVELIAAIKVGGLTSDLTDRLKEALPGLKDELSAIAQGKEPIAAGGNFWENSI